MPNAYDAIIVGGGPAGSTAAYYLAKNKNLKILIVDRYSFPRDKACGGVLNHLDEIEKFENYREIENILKKHETNSIRFYYDKKEIFYKEYRRLFYHINRFEFDNLLMTTALRKKNVNFLKFNVQEIKEGKEYISLKDGDRLLYCKYLIGADGWCSTVSGYLGNEIRSLRDYGLCTEYEIECKKMTLDNHIFYLYNKEIGYAWLFPSAKGYYLGLGFVGKTKKSINEYLNEFKIYCEANKLIPKKSKIKRSFGAPDPITTARKYSTSHIILCGDALGVTKQVSGEGIYFAMLSGKVAGEILREKKESLEPEYKDRIRPIIRNSRFLRKLPPRILINFSFGVLFQLLISKCLSHKGKLRLQDWFVERFLEIRPLR